MAVLRGTRGNELFNEIDVFFADSPYTPPLDTDAYINVDTTDGEVEIVLPAITEELDRRTYHIVDSVFNCLLNNIIITPDGVDKTENDTEIVMNTNGLVQSIRGNNTTKNWKIV